MTYSISHDLSLDSKDTQDDLEEVCVLPSSFAQRRLWFLDQWEPGVYNIPTAVRLTGQMNVAAMEEGLREIIRRHEVLRTTFRMVDGELQQVIAPHIPFSMPVVELQHFPEDVRKVKMRRLVREDIQTPFDLRNGPLIRSKMLKLGEQEHALLVTMHHIVSDAWSMSIFFQELATLYTCYATGQPSSLPELTLQYADYALWQREWLQGEILETQLAYWKKQLGDIPVLQLPIDHSRPAMQTFRGAAQILLLSAAVTKALRALSRQEGATLFMTLLAAFKTLLYRYCNQESIIVGIPIAGRTESKLEGLIGCFINTLALHTDLSGNPTFRELLRRVRETALGAYTHQDLPFERLVEELHLERDLSRNPLTQVMFALQNIPRGQLSLPRLTLSALKLDSETAMLKQGDANWMSRQQSLKLESEPAMFDLDLTMWESGTDLIGELKYNTDLFDAATIKYMQGHFLTLLEGIVADPNRPIADIPLLSEQEQQMLLDWNTTETSDVLEEPYMRLFAQQVQRTPEAVAVLFQDRHLTYRQLHQRVCELAGQLRRLDAGPEQLVAVLAERGPDLLVALLALLQVGAAYLPLDPHAPPARLRQVLERSGSPLVLTTTSLIPLGQQVVQALSPQRQPTFYNLQDVPSTNTLLDDQPFASQPGQLAYVIYTSGSTGVPKGAMVEQQGMLNHLFAKIDALHLSAEDVVAQTASQCFDISVWQFLAVLLVGGSVHILPDAIAHDPSALLHTLAQQPLSVLETVPSLLRFLLDVAEAAGAQPPPLPHLRWLIPTGEALPPELCRRWLQVYPQVPLLNAYGPTECSDDVTHAPIVEPPPASVTSMSIGRALPNLHLYVLDRHLRPTPLGVSGEIYVGGIGVGRGYLGEPERTAQSFLPDPFSGRAGARLYKTGDRARYLPDGSLEFQGRLDQQVKLRGYRIELGEIEAVLHGHAEVREAVVLLREDEPGNQQLVAYVVGRAAPSLGSEQLRLYLKERLPEYMVPSVIVLLEALPIGPTGKLDRHALPPPDVSRLLRDTEYVAPRNATEETLASIWSDLLGQKEIGVHDDFFTIGGHSLLTVRLVARLEKQMGKRIPLAAIFQYRTIEALALLLQPRTNASPWAFEDEAQESKIDLHAEAVLDSTTCPEVWPGDLGCEPDTIFLTGATGFLGTFLLAELLQRTRADIYCLIRATNEEVGKQKLQHILKEAQLLQPAFADRIIPVPGDLALPRFGLTQEAFEHLTCTIDVIYHNGALVNTIYPYRELKAANVQGTQEVIRLATFGKVKPLHYVSTMSVFSRDQSTKGKTIREQESIDEHAEHLHNGYAQSKWVAEKIITMARSRGLPVAIYRPGRITGHSQMGTWRTQDMLCRMIKGCIQLGSVPIQEVDEQLEMTPVDYVSQAIVALSKRKSSFGQAFHLFNPTTVGLNDLITWTNDFGYTVHKLPEEQWRAELLRVSEDSMENAMSPFVSLLSREDLAEEKGQQAQPAPKRTFDMRNTRLGLTSTSIACPKVDAKLLSTYLSYLVSSGFLPAPQQRPNQ